MMKIFHMGFGANGQKHKLALKVCMGFDKPEETSRR
jgi:hypothetical protein